LEDCPSNGPAAQRGQVLHKTALPSSTSRGSKFKPYEIGNLRKKHPRRLSANPAPPKQAKPTKNRKAELCVLCGLDLSVVAHPDDGNCQKQQTMRQRQKPVRVKKIVPKFDLPSKRPSTDDFVRIVNVTDVVCGKKEAAAINFSFASKF